MSDENIQVEDDPLRCFLVIIVVDQKPSIEEFPDIPAMGKKILELQQFGDSVQVFPFFGWRLYLTKGPFRYLTKKGMEPIPCFEPPDPNAEIDPDGMLSDAADEGPDLQYKKLISEISQVPALEDQTALQDPFASFSDDTSHDEDEDSGFFDGSDD